MQKYIIRRIIREIAPPITKEGIEIKERHNVDSAKDFLEGKRPKNFTPSTVIMYGGGYAVWELEVPEDIRKNLSDMTLKIETVRTHGMLHAPPSFKGKSASIFVNDQLLDEIILVRPHSHGEDLGVDSRRPFPVFRYIDKAKSVQTIRIQTDEGVCWDIDRVTLEPIILRKEIRQWIFMVFGAILSAAMGGLVTFLLRCQL
jgi:hypothetical protein